MVEIIRWISIGLLWAVIGFNVVVMVHLKRTSRELDEQVRIWKARNGYLDETSEEARRERND